MILGEKAAHAFSSEATSVPFKCLCLARSLLRQHHPAHHAAGVLRTEVTDNNCKLPTQLLFFVLEL